jgi:hypothetical protein
VKKQQNEDLLTLITSRKKLFVKQKNPQGKNSTQSEKRGLGA